MDKYIDTRGLLTNLVAAGVIGLITWLVSLLSGRDSIPVPPWVMALLVTWIMATTVWPPLARYKAKNRKRRTIYDKDFVTERVEIDGITYVNCRFERCSLVFRAQNTFGFDSCTFDAHTTWQFDDKAGIAIHGLQAMMTADPWRQHIQNTLERDNPFLTNVAVDDSTNPD